MGANNGALHTTWRNSGAGVGGAAVDIGDPGLEEVKMGDADRLRKYSVKYIIKMITKLTFESWCGHWDRE